MLQECKYHHPRVSVCLLVQIAILRPRVNLARCADRVGHHEVVGDEVLSIKYLHIIIHNGAFSRLDGIAEFFLQLEGLVDVVQLYLLQIHELLRLLSLQSRKLFLFARAD